MTPRPAQPPGGRAWTPARPTPWPPSPAGPAWRWWSARRGRARRPCWPPPRQPCGPRGGSWWCWPPPARRPRWPPRSWGPGHARWPSCSTTTAGAGTTSAVIPAPPSSPASRSPPTAGPGGQGYQGPGDGWRSSAGSVVVVDEAGLLSVDQAVALIDVVRGSGASLRLVGDPRQLGAVGRGGVMETAARWAPGGEVTLGQVHRFLTPGGRPRRPAGHRPRHRLGAAVRAVAGGD